MKNILDLDTEELKLWMEQNKEKSFRAKQIFQWIYKGIFDFKLMKNIPIGTIDKLEKEFYIDIPKVVTKLVSKDEDTIKFLFAYRDGNLIESVVMKYKHGNSICVSTQVGCRMGCKFCASTIEGMVRNLSSGEILSQILKAQEEIGERISNVVLMGSGEPLDNYENVIKFIKEINKSDGFNIGQRHITLSTCGIVPKIKELAQEKLQITLAISLHAPNDTLRRQVMPIANKYSISEILDMCKYYINMTNRRVSFEYALVKGFNDGIEQAKELSNTLRGMLCHVNLIPVNEIKENSLKKSSSDNILKFKNILCESGIETTIRREMGADIDAACGQLRRHYLNN
ncbi:23S rRNA (adenine(2503)-C(2))-methyltransferase RlmN [Haloimpatiens lingqiaonensis]|uniref:23S rRNA (adenine(2503)-C(2))-methyltransferase RlmN n=1 Tax=Haloimpatiens lingqiaonensis TaxID=1380675 RepID=UPI0010FD56CF|nr:23S rRNA (adenine(2503)-C(2))-methyltransferase RlmN [Haloimpatiens lingqiaonensis]